MIDHDLKQMDSDEEDLSIADPDLDDVGVGGSLLLPYTN